MPRSRQCAARAAGFTLMEVMLVVLIVLILTGVAVPTLRGTFRSAQMSDALRATVRAARHARSLAILQQETCTLRFEKDRLSLFCGTNSAAPETSRQLPEDIRIGAFENLSAAETPRRGGEADRSVRYYAGGMNDGFRLTLEGPDGRRATVRCHPASGKVKVTDESP